MKFPRFVKYRFKCSYNCCQFQRKLMQTQNNWTSFCTVQLSQHFMNLPGCDAMYFGELAGPPAFRGSLVVPSSGQTEDPSNQRWHILLNQWYPPTKPHSITTQEHLDFMYAVPHQTIPSQTKACASELSPTETTQHRWWLQFMTAVHSIQDGLRRRYDANFTLMLMKQMTVM